MIFIANTDGNGSPDHSMRKLIVGCSESERSVHITNYLWLSAIIIVHITSYLQQQKLYVYNWKKTAKKRGWELHKCSHYVRRLKNDTGFLDSAIKWANENADGILNSNNCHWQDTGSWGVHSGALKKVSKSENKNLLNTQ